MSNPILELYPALGFALYRRYWFASFASVGATQIITLGQGWLIFELSGSALQLGVLGAAAAVPNILMTLIGGVIADRFDKRIILMSTSLTITFLLAALAWLDFSGTVQVWHVLTVAALVSLVSGLDWPTRVSIYTHLIDRSAFMSAVALNSFIWQSTRMAMPALGGVIILYSVTMYTDPNKAVTKANARVGRYQPTCAVHANSTMATIAMAAPPSMTTPSFSIFSIPPTSNVPRTEPTPPAESR